MQMGFIVVCQHHHINNMRVKHRRQAAVTSGSCNVATSAEWIFGWNTYSHPLARTHNWNLHEAGKNRTASSRATTDKEWQRNAATKYRIPLIG